MTQRRTRRKRPAAPVRKTARRWRVPPPLTHGPEPLEGGTILEELRDERGVVLWQTARDVSLWATAPDDRRSSLFSTTALGRRRRQVESLGMSSELAASILAASGPLGARARPEEVARGCESIARWADSQALPGVSLAFWQAVALIRAADAGAAYEVGVQARRRSEEARAETWFRRAIMLARQSGDWLTYSRAFVALGDLHIDRGSSQVARKFHVRASRTAKRHGLSDVAREALAGLARLDGRAQTSKPNGGAPPRRSDRARP